MTIRRSYVRPMDGWWRRNAYFRKYMARELTAFFVAAYALVLLAGLIRLSQGARAFAEWREGLSSAWSLAVHVALLAAFLYHAWSFFEIMPRTMPPIVLGGKRLSGSAVSRLGLGAAALASLGLIVLARQLAR